MKSNIKERYYIYRVKCEIKIIFDEKPYISKEDFYFTLKSYCTKVNDLLSTISIIKKELESSYDNVVINDISFIGETFILGEKDE